MDFTCSLTYGLEQYIMDLVVSKLTQSLVIAMLHIKLM